LFIFALLNASIANIFSNNIHINCIKNCDGQLASSGGPRRKFLA